MLLLSFCAAAITALPLYVYSVVRPPQFHCIDLYIPPTRLHFLPLLPFVTLITTCKNMT